ncbi:hypothetical protein WA026_011413 [Henosepilachna vigintioctopunctata]|uniref:G-protein coupled receptors family 1 profile domain-containing protein n=1 Tax=Henosepilachna vigintioctopunctata TaxID=420089 RepID=A0AAW1TSL5_9CUCU
MCSRREDSYLIIILFSFMDTFLDLPDILNGVVQSLKVEAYVIEMLSGCVGAALHDFYKTIAVVVTFFICWAPFHAQRLLAIYGERSSSKMIKAYLTLTYISGVLYYLSTTVNPLLYNIMSHKFREAFKNTFRQCFRRHLVVMDPGGASRAHSATWTPRWRECTILAGPWSSPSDGKRRRRLLAGQHASARMNRAPEANCRRCKSQE